MYLRKKCFDRKIFWQRSILNIETRYRRKYLLTTNQLRWQYPPFCFVDQALFKTSIENGYFLLSKQSAALARLIRYSAIIDGSLKAIRRTHRQLGVLRVQNMRYGWLEKLQSWRGICGSREVPTSRLLKENKFLCNNAIAITTAHFIHPGVYWYKTVEEMEKLGFYVSFISSALCYL